MEDARGFFASLLDFSFTSFITTKLIKLIYILSVAAAGLLALFTIVGALSQGFMAALAMLIIAPIVAVMFVATVRIWLELAAVLFRAAEYQRETAEHTRKIAAAQHAPTATSF